MIDLTETLHLLPTVPRFVCTTDVYHTLLFLPQEECMIHIRGVHRNSVLVMRNIQFNIYRLWPIGLIYHYEYRACWRSRHAMVVDPVTFVLPTVNSPNRETRFQADWLANTGFTSFLPDGNRVRLPRLNENASMSFIVLVPSGQWGLETGLLCMNLLLPWSLHSNHRMNCKRVMYVRTVWLIRRSQRAPLDLHYPSFSLPAIRFLLILSKTLFVSKTTQWDKQNIWQQINVSF